MCRRAVALYREVRPLVQRGDLWRLLPPDERAALSYVSPDGDEAVVFGFQLVDRSGGAGAGAAPGRPSDGDGTYEVTASTSTAGVAADPAERRRGRS